MNRGGLTLIPPVLGGVGCVLMLGACASQAGPVPGASQSPATQSPATQSVAATSSPRATSAAASAPAASHPASPATGPAGSASRPASLAACRDSQVAVTLTHTGALAGQAGGYLTFTNHGGTACELTGWPTVVGLNEAGKSAALAHATATMFGAWQYTAPMPVVTLAPGQAAYAVVAGDSIPAGTPGTCLDPIKSLRVTIPGGSAVAVVSAWLPGAGTYLPACTGMSGAPGDKISDIVGVSALPH